MFAKDKCHLHFTLNKPHCICLRLVSHAPKILRAIVCGVLFVIGREGTCVSRLVEGRAVILSGNHAYVVSCLRYRARILSDNYLMSLPAAISSRVCAVG